MTESGELIPESASGHVGWKALLNSPVVVVALVGLVGAGVGSLVTHINNQGQLQLERQKQETAVVFRLLEGAKDEASLDKNLLFLVNAGILRDPNGLIRKHLEPAKNTTDPKNTANPSSPATAGAAPQSTPPRKE
jgi:hypothetical protein